MSNVAAMVLIVPIAVDTALGLGANHITFTMAVVIGAATSFLSPVGHKANVVVFGPGGYRLFDYARVGALLTVALLIASMIFLPLFWPLFPWNSLSHARTGVIIPLAASSVALHLALAVQRAHFKQPKQKDARKFGSAGPSTGCREVSTCLSTGN